MNSQCVTSVLQVEAGLQSDGDHGDTVNGLLTLPAQLHPEERGEWSIRSIIHQSVKKSCFLCVFLTCSCSIPAAAALCVCAAAGLSSDTDGQLLLSPRDDRDGNKMESVVDNKLA